MQVPQKYRNDKIYLKLSSITLEDWKKLSAANKQKRWYNASKYGNDNPLLSIGVIEEEVKDEYNAYARNLRCKSKEELIRLRTRRVVSDPDVETLKTKIVELEDAHKAEIQSKDEIIERLNNELSERDKRIAALERNLSEDQLTVIQADLRFAIDLLDKKEQAKSMLESINRRLGKLVLSHSS